MLKFFDLIFYHSYGFYVRHEEKGAVSTAATIIGGLQAMNVVMFLMVLALISQTKIYFPNAPAIIGLAKFFQVTTYIRYVYKEKVTPEILKERWARKTDSQKVRLRCLMVVYTLLSTIGFFGLAIYLGSKEW